MLLCGSNTITCALVCKCTSLINYCRSERHKWILIRWAEIIGPIAAEPAGPVPPALHRGQPPQNPWKGSSHKSRSRNALGSSLLQQKLSSSGPSGTHETQVCLWCRTHFSHDRAQCPAKDAVYHRCSKKRYFKDIHVCMQKQKHHWRHLWRPTGSYWHSHNWGERSFIDCQRLPLWQILGTQDWQRSQHNCDFYECL